MSLNTRVRHRCHVWRWRARYWWMDTHNGAIAHILLLCVSALVVVIQFIYAGIAMLAPPKREPQQAIIWWVVYLIVMLIAAAVSYAMRPKPQSKTQDNPTGPTTEDGQSVVRYWGTHWVDDEFLLAWKITGRDPIKASGGK
ncbi:MAG: hypothetical protein ABI114_11070 [Rhodanobacter sp.]